MDYKLTRCPVCGSTSLTPAYNDDSQQKGGDLKLFMFGVIGLAVEAFKCGTRKDKAYWICNICGTSFADEE